MRFPRRSIPPVSGLIAFEATARRLSFSHAAADLALSQGAVSKRVRQLEDQLGVALLTRGGHKISLTRAGQGYLPKVQDILAQIDRTSRELLSTAGGEQVLSVGTAPAFAIGWLLPRLAEFNRTWPDLRIDLLDIDTGSDFDLAIDANGGTPMDLTIRCVAPGSASPNERVLFSETFVACVGRQATAGRSDTELLASLPLLRQAGAPELRECLGADESDMATAMEGVVDHCGILISTAMHGHGIALAPNLLVQDDLRNGRLRQIGKPRSVGSYVMAISARALGSPEAQGFYDWVVATAPRSPSLRTVNGAEKCAEPPPGRPEPVRRDKLPAYR